MPFLLYNQLSIPKPLKAFIPDGDDLDDASSLKHQQGNSILLQTRVLVRENSGLEGSRCRQGLVLIVSFCATNCKLKLPISGQHFAI